MSGGAFVVQQSLTVAFVSPGIGLASGGSTVTIRGWDFAPNTTVTIGSVPAADVVVLDSGTLTATTAAHAAGLVDVVVTNRDHDSATLRNGFVYADVINQLFFPLAGR